MMQPDKIEQAAAILATAKVVVAFTGAGVSQESGIPTFRNAQTGLWKKYDPEDLATPAAFQRNPKLVWSWYLHRLTIVSAAHANPGHHALVDLAAQIHQTHVITQNVDDLHERAGSMDVIHLHGRLGQFRCSQDCTGLRSLVEISADSLTDDHVPLCPNCGAFVRPNVVWFGEQLEPTDLARAFELASTCDVMLVIGTSGVVQPASLLPVRAREHGAKVIIVNPMKTDQLASGDIHLQAASGDVLPAVVNTLNNLLGRG